MTSNELTQAAQTTAKLARTDVNEMTRKEFEALPYREAWDKPVTCDSIIILPSRELHDSGYRLLDFVAVLKNVPVCKLSGCSDVLHIDGIAGFGKDWLNKYGSCPQMVPPSGWSIDCLAKSGLLRMWPSSFRIECGIALSSFEIYALEKEPNDAKVD